MRLRLWMDGAFNWVVCVSLVGLTWLMHGSAMAGWWRFDDSLVLAFVLEQPNPLTHFFAPETWRALGVPFFTPFLTLDFTVSRIFFGVEPSGFYAQGLGFVVLAGWMTFLLMRQYVSRAAAWFSAALFVCGTPTTVVAQQLMSKHYVVGLVFAMATLMAWRIAVARRSGAWAWLASGLYLAASLCKEIYAPLPLVAFALDLSPWRDRLRLFWPWVAAALAFVCWRAVMLGHWIGGHSDGLHEGWGWVDSIALFPAVFWGAGALAGTAAAALAAGLWLGMHWRVASGLAVAVCAAIALPFLASRLTLDPADWRLAFLPWWVACLLAGGGFEVVRGKWIAMLPWVGSWMQCLVLLLGGGLCLTLTVVHAQASLKALAPQLTAFDVQGRYYWEAVDGQAYVPAGHLNGYLHAQWGLATLREFAGKGPGPLAIPFLEMAPTLGSGLVVRRYSALCDCMEVLDARGPVAAEVGEMARFSIARDANALRWDLHAVAGEQCYWAFPQWGGGFAVPCRGALHWDLPYLKGDMTAVWRLPSGAWRMTPLQGFPASGENVVYEGLAWGRP